MRAAFKNEMLIYQSKANLDGEILLRKITHHLDLEIGKSSERTCLGMGIPHFILVQYLLALKL